METDATRRFSSRVEDYIKYRPGYPPAIMGLVARECGLRPGQTVADIGSGTGLLSVLFLQFGCEVYGVEPNREMRQAGERLLAGETRFHSVEGRAEATGLADGSADLVAAGQAFHWFDRERARAEFLRITRPPHPVVLVWNERLVTGRFLEGYEELLRRYSTDYDKVDHRQVDAATMDAFFGSGSWQTRSFPNEQQFDLEGVLGRLHSSSYAPPVGSPIDAALTRLFEECQRDERVAFVYETKVYWGRLTSTPPGPNRSGA